MDVVGMKQFVAPIEEKLARKTYGTEFEGRNWMVRLMVGPGAGDVGNNLVPFPSSPMPLGP
jgi:hypothetical protein